MARPKLNLTEEQRATRDRELQRLRQTRYRIKKGDLSVGIGKGRPFHNEVRTTEKHANFIVHTKTIEEDSPVLGAMLTKDSKVEDLLPWALELAQQLRENRNPAAWASALNSVLKIIEYLEKKYPPERPPVKPRPRMAIVINDIEEEQEDV